MALRPQGRRIPIEGVEGFRAYGCALRCEYMEHRSAAAVRRRSGAAPFPRKGDLRAGPGSAPVIVWIWQNPTVTEGRGRMARAEMRIHGASKRSSRAKKVRRGAVPPQGRPPGRTGQRPRDCVDMAKPNGNGGKRENQPPPAFTPQVPRMASATILVTSSLSATWGSVI